MSTLTFSYKPKIWIMLFCILFFGAIAALFANVALTNDRGLILNHIFTLSQDWATNFYWVMFALSAGFVAVSLWGLVLGLTSSKQIILGPTGMRAPKSVLSGKIIDIPYRDITDILDQSVHRQVFLAVYGKTTKVTIAQTSLASKEEFQQMRNALIERANQH